MVRWPGEEDTAPDEIVFAVSPGHAKSNSEAYSLNGKNCWNELRVSRRPQFDRYAEQGHVPMMAMVEDGWWFECCVCGRMVGADEIEHEGAVIAGELAYCGIHAHVKSEAEPVEGGGSDD